MTKKNKLIGVGLAFFLLVLGWALFGKAPASWDALRGERPREDEAWLKGKVEDGSSMSIIGIKVVARQVQPIEGYERIEARTGPPGPQGYFTLKGLYPSSKYELTLEGAEGLNWDSYIATGLGIIESAPGGAIGLLPEEVAVAAAFTESGSAILLPYYPKRARYTKSPQGVILDGYTDYEWYAMGEQIGVDKFDSAFRQAATLDVDGGGWRLPTPQEVMKLYNEHYPNHIDVAFSDSVEGEIELIMTDRLQNPEETKDVLRVCMVVDFVQGKYAWKNFLLQAKANPFVIRDTLGPGEREAIKEEMNTILNNFLGNDSEKEDQD